MMSTIPYRCNIADRSVPRLSGRGPVRCETALGLLYTHIKLTATGSLERFHNVGGLTLYRVPLEPHVLR